MLLLICLVKMAAYYFFMYSFNYNDNEQLVFKLQTLHSIKQVIESSAKSTKQYSSSVIVSSLAAHFLEAV
jgi:hypothetical protein